MTIQKCLFSSPLLDVDETIPRKTIDAFVSQGGCTLTLYECGRHWLHTEEELSFMREWERKALSL